MTNIQKFSFYNAPVKNKYPNKNIDIADAASLIKCDSYKDLTDQVRFGASDKTEVLPYVTFSGTFTSRGNTNLINYSGHICIDLDHIDVKLKDTLAGDTVLNPALIFISPRGEGLKVVISIENATPEKHLAYFQSLERYFRDTYQLAIDTGCKDMARACFLCHDPEIFYNPSGYIRGDELLSYLPISQEPKQIPGVKPTSQSPQSPYTLTSLPSEYLKPSAPLNLLTAVENRAKEALTNDGWVFSPDGETCTRPGKDPKDGTSGKFNRDPKDGIMKFTNFSSSVLNLTAKGYTSVQLICELEFKGDWNVCIKELANEYLPKPHLPQIGIKQAGAHSLPIDDLSILPGEEKHTEKKPKLPPTPPLPIDGMPDFIQKFITTCSEIYGTSRDYWAMSAIMATALAIGNKIELKGKYKNIPLLWAVNIGPVSCGKTEPQKLCFEPFEKLDNASHENWLIAYNEFEAIPITERKKQKIQPPEMFQYIVKDCTPEALQKVHSVNQRGLIFSRDELKGMIDDFGRYSKSGEQSNMLSSWMRVQWVTNRKGGGIDSKIIIPKPCIYIFGGLQPDLLPSLAADNRAENGFLSRMCNAWPDNTNKPKYNKETIPEELMRDWEKYIIGLTQTQPRDITLSAEAEKLYEDWFNQNADMTNSEQSGHLKGVYGKLDIIALRLVVVIYGMNLAKGYVFTKEIKEKEMQTALNITEYFRATALKVHEKLFTQCSDADNTREVIRYLAGLGHSQVKIGEIIGKSQQYVGKVLGGTKGVQPTTTYNL